MSLIGYHLAGPAGAPVLVLGPSLGSTMEVWRPHLDTLSRDHRVLRYDLLGHATSRVPPGPYTLDQLGRAVLEVLDEAGAERVRYAGVSLGGMIGMWLAVHAPERIERLALICTSAYLPPAEGWTQRAALVRARGCGAVADTVVGRWFTDGFRARSPEVAAAYRQMIAATDPEGYAGCCEAIGAMDQRDSIAGITAPTLVVAGRDDPSTPAEHGGLIAATVPGARFVIVADAAHLAVVERAPEVGALLTGFLEEAR
jgi:3-oxoadipate enol-lactonase